MTVPKKKTAKPGKKDALGDGNTSVSVRLLPEEARMVERGTKIRGHRNRSEYLRALIRVAHKDTVILEKLNVRSDTS